MLRFSKMRIGLLALAALTALAPLSARAQDDPNDAPLGDVARNLRKKPPAGQGVIDNDNLSQVMDQVENKRTAGTQMKFLMAGDGQGFRVSAPDVSCSLSFTANTKALLSSQYAQMDLPAEAIPKLAGPAAIEGDALTVSVFNATDWHISELDVALTVVKKNLPGDVQTSLESVTDSPSGAEKLARSLDVAQNSAVRPEKKPDTTVIYRMRAAAAPWARTTFSAPLNLDLAPGDEWHWALVQAKGYPPQSYTAKADQPTTQTSSAIPSQSTMIPSQSPIIPASLLQPDSSESATPSASPLPSTSRLSTISPQQKDSQ
jgi:hypothetical protein